MIKSLEVKIENLRSIHHNRYDYSLVKTINMVDKIDVICPEHGIFKTLYNNHLAGRGCPKCGRIKMGKSINKNRLEKKFRGLIQPEEYKLIPGTKGKFAMVDNEDFERLKDINWSYNDSNSTLASSTTLIGRFIMDCPKGMVVDHINGNPLDNRRCNLRIITQKNNLKNRKYWGKQWHPDYNGVMYNKILNKWTSCIQDDGNIYLLGNFNTPEEAAENFDKHAIKLNKHIRLNSNE